MSITESSILKPQLFSYLSIFLFLCILILIIHIWESWSSIYCYWIGLLFIVWCPLFFLCSWFNISLILGTYGHFIWVLFPLSFTYPSFMDKLCVLSRKVNFLSLTNNWGWELPCFLPLHSISVNLIDLVCWHSGQLFTFKDLLHATV